MANRSIGPAPGTAILSAGVHAMPQPPAVQRTCAIDEFTRELRRFPAAAFDRIDAIAGFLAANTVAPNTLAPYLCWDRQHYTRNLIDKTPLYELIAICWEVGQGSSIHNHKGQNCWMAVPIGRLLIQNYRVLNQDLDSGSCDIVPTDIVEMNPSS